MQRNLYLEGELGAKFGQRLSINAKNIQQVIKILDVNFPDFKKYLLESNEKGVGFTIQVAEDSVDEEGLFIPLKEGDVIISPVPAGSKSGVGRIFAGIALIALTFATGGFAVAPSLGTMTASAASIAGGGAISTGMLVGLSIGVNLALVGIQQMMAPDPSIDTTAPQSYLYNGSDQNIVEGDPVPLLYGELRVPGRPIGFGVAVTGNNYSSSIPTDTDESSNDVVTSQDPSGNGDINTEPNTTTTPPVSTIDSITPSTLFVAPGETVVFSISTSNIDSGTVLPINITKKVETAVSTMVTVDVDEDYITIDDNGNAQYTYKAPLITVANVTFTASVYSSELNIATVTSQAVTTIRATITGPTEVSELGGPYTYTVSAPGFGTGQLEWYTAGTEFVIDVDPTDSKEGNPLWVGGTIDMQNSEGTFEITMSNNLQINSNSFFGIYIKPTTSAYRIGDMTVQVIDDSIPEDVTPGTDTTDDQIDITPDPKLDIFRPGNTNQS